MIRRHCVVVFGGRRSGGLWEAAGREIDRWSFACCFFFGSFGLSLLVFRDCLVGGPDGLVVSESEAQGIIPVATFAVGVVLGVLSRSEIAVGDVGVVPGMVGCIDGDYHGFRIAVDVH